MNKVIFSQYPEYKRADNEYNNINVMNGIDEKENIENIKIPELVSKNMTLNDIQNQKEDNKNKKMSAFTQFISYKKEKVLIDNNENIEQNDKSNSIEEINIDDQPEKNNIDQPEKNNIVQYKNQDTIKNIELKKNNLTRRIYTTS